MKKNLLIVFSLIIATFFVGCNDNDGIIPNKDKPLIFFNRQPANPVTGAVDMSAMRWNRQTYYVGFDVASGGMSQGKLITDFLATADPEVIDRNGDGIIGYVLLIGDEGNTDSKARTEGIRKALGTWNGAADPVVKRDGSVLVGGTTFKVVELEARTMVGADGSTWNTEAAAAVMQEWFPKYGQQIDMVISNNDAMALACLNGPEYQTGTGFVYKFPTGLPIFGFDASADAIESISEGVLTGTVSQNDDAQAAAAMQLLRNLLDGVEGSDVYKVGFTTFDEYNNKVMSKIEYEADVKAFLAPDGGPVNSINWYDYSGNPRDHGLKKIDAPLKKVLVVISNEADNLLTETFLPSMEYYARLLNIELTVVSGDGKDEVSCLDKFVGVSKYDAYVINMVKSNSGRHYTAKLKDLR